jgi:hypothetical protein
MTMFRFFCVVWFVLTTSLFASQGVFDSYDIRQKAMGGVQVASIKRVKHTLRRKQRRRQNKPNYTKKSKHGHHTLLIN